MFLYPFSPELRRLRGIAITVILLMVGIGLLMGSLIHRDVATGTFSVVLLTFGSLGLSQYWRSKKNLL